MKKTKKLLCLIGLLLMTVTVLVACGHEHAFGTWQVSEKPTCQSDGSETRSCACGETESRVLSSVGHSYTDATCTEPRRCEDCGATVGSALGHSYAQATCTEPKTCTVCRDTVGSALGHSYAQATCTEPKTCTVCRDTVGSALGHTYEKGICLRCDAIAPGAKEEQMATAKKVVEDIDDLAHYCDVISNTYYRAWYFSIYKAEDYYSYTEALSDFCSYTGLEQNDVLDATIAYLESLGLETTQMYCLAALRTSSAVVNIVGRIVNSAGFDSVCGDLASSIAKNLQSVNGKVVGDAVAEALVDYANAGLNFYAFTKEPSGSLSSYSSERTTYQNACTNYGTKIKLWIE